MPKLIVVQGISNSGKTSSIIEFMRSYRNVHANPFPAELVVPIQKNGTWILGVAKDGDTALNVSRAVNMFSRFNCDIVVCATKSSGASVTALNSFIAANRHISVVRVRTSWVALPAAQIQNNSLIAATIESHLP